MKKEVLAMFVFVLLGISFANAVTETSNLHCGNNICEKYEKVFTAPGQTDSLTIQGKPVVLSFIRGDKDTDAIYKANDYEGKMSEITNMYFHPFAGEYFDFVVLMMDYSKYNIYDYVGKAVSLKEEQYCPLDCIGDTQTDNYQIAIALKPGWNLVHMDKVGFSDCSTIPPGTICKDDVLATFVYIPSLKKYINSETAEKEYSQEELRTMGNELTGFGSAFVYLKESARNKRYSFTFFKGQTNEFESRNLKAGWNFVGITQDMYSGNWNPEEGYEGEYFSWDAIKGNCNYERIYYWNPEEQNWGSMDSSLQIKSYDFDDFLGLGMVIKVAENCTLGEVTSTTAPPSLPNDEITTPVCTDSDEGLDYYTKGNATGPYYDALSNTTRQEDNFDSCIAEYSQYYGETDAQGLINLGLINEFSDIYDENLLFEVICIDNGFIFSSYNCPSGCQDGACL